jgi:hypothetical protein
LISLDIVRSFIEVAETGVQVDQGKVISRDLKEGDFLGRDTISGTAIELIMRQLLELL